MLPRAVFVSGAAAAKKVASATSVERRDQSIDLSAGGEKFSLELELDFKCAAEKEEAAAAAATTTTAAAAAEGKVIKQRARRAEGGRRRARGRNQRLAAKWSVAQLSPAIVSAKFLS